jgi:predicted small lipoprotein YifL
MRWVLFCLLVMQAATCGQKGPLTLPDRGGAGLSAHVVAVVD